jgi:hypothetical protein
MKNGLKEQICEAVFMAVANMAQRRMDMDAVDSTESTMLLRVKDKEQFSHYFEVSVKEKV